MSNIKDVQDVISYESGLKYYTNPARDNCSIRQLLCLGPCTDSFCPTELKDASGSIDILVTVLQIEGVNYNEGFMADGEGWAPRVMRHNGAAWTVTK